MEETMNDGVSLWFCPQRPAWLLTYHVKNYLEGIVLIPCIIPFSVVDSLSRSLYQWPHLLKKC